MQQAVQPYAQRGTEPPRTTQHRVALLLAEGKDYGLPRDREAEREAASLGRVYEVRERDVVPGQGRSARASIPGREERNTAREERGRGEGGGF